MHPQPGFAKAAKSLRGAIHRHNEAASTQRAPGPGGHPARFKKLLDVIQTDIALPKTDTDALTLVARLRRLVDNRELFAFLTEPDVPPTNNWSEQALRPWKVRQRRSECFRSEAAAKQWFRIAGYADTARKKGVGPIESLRLAVVGTPVMP